MTPKKNPKWTPTLESFVIKFYKTHPLLWDTKRSDYKKCNIAKELEQLSLLMGEEFTVEEIKKQFAIMRNTFFRNLIKVKRSRVKGSPDLFRPKFRHYKALMFLRHRAMPLTVKLPSTARKPATSNALPSTARKPATSNTRPSTATKPATSYALPPTARKSATSYALPPTATKPATSYALPSTATKPAASYALPPTATKHATSYALPPTARKPATSNTLPSTARKPATSNTLPPTATKPATWYALPSTARKPATETATASSLGNANNPGCSRAVGSAEGPHDVITLSPPTSSRPTVRNVPLSKTTKRHKGSVRSNLLHIPLPVPTTVPATVPTTVPATVPEVEDDSAVFGTQVTLALREMDPWTRSRAKLDLYQTLLKYNPNNPNQN